MFRMLELCDYDGGLLAHRVAIALASRNSICTIKNKAEIKTQNATAEETDARLQRVVHMIMIILSDILCWIPFTITSIF